MALLDFPVIFLHIPKTAGTTFRSIICNNYQQNEVCFIYEADEGTPLHVFENMKQEERDKLKMAGGHIRFGLHRHFSEKARYITFLRHPVERVISLYDFLLHTPHNRFHQTASQCKSLEDFVLNFNGGRFNNGQSRRIAGPGVGPKRLLEKAQQHLDEHFAAVGLVEKFDQSLQLFSKKLGWKKLEYEHKNVNQQKRRLADVSQSTLMLIEEKNAVDAALYRYAEQRLEERAKI